MTCGDPDLETTAKVVREIAAAGAGIIELGIPFSFIFTKADKIGPVKAQQNVNLFCKTLLETWEELPPHFVSSALTAQGKEEILDYIEQINNQYYTPQES